MQPAFPVFVNDSVSSMPRIQMSRGERASLEMILKRPCLVTDIPGEHAEKLLNYGLIKREVMLLHATPRGQVEILRQRFKSTGYERPLTAKVAF
jgi:hypothetical protein